MKLQHLSVIFVIIVIPIILVVSYYISLQIDTINMQTSYNSKLLDATKEAIESFEINTVEWNESYSQTADSKRRDIMASIDTFTTSFANSLGVGGTSKENILTYIPAVAFTLYDGYYIYSPTETKEVIKDDNGVAVIMSEKLKNTKKEDGTKILQGYDEGNIEGDIGKILYQYQVKDGGASNGTYNGTSFTLNPNDAKPTYSHILKPFSSYSARYKKGNTDIIVNYTLDNYITIYGTVDGEYEIRSGYFINNENLLITPKSLNITVNGQEITTETLKETIWYQGLALPKEFTYIYASDKTKVYFDENEEPFQVSSTGERTNLSETNSVKYKKLSIMSDDNKYCEIFQALNSKKSDEIEKGKWYWETDKKNQKDISDFGQGEIDIKEDVSSINYYVESYCFTDWVIKNLGDITIGDMQELKSIEDEEDISYGDEESTIFAISKDNNPEKEDSVFFEHKREIIKQTLISNLNQSITSYSRNSKGEYKLPELSETDWDQVLRNVSIITFVQGIPIGLKYYNNYAIATSTANKEYVNPDEIYLNGSDGYYHLPGCTKIEGDNIIGYRNIDYKIRSYNDTNSHNLDDENTKYYYKHNITTNYNDTTRQECYYCLVQRDLYSYEFDEQRDLAYKTALARERYNNRETRM